jgi:hypothetical protein
MIYYVLALSLYPQDSYEEVMRHLSEADQFGSSWNVPSKVAIFKARLRLGAEPMRRLYETVTKPLVAPVNEGVFYRGLRLVVIYGGSLSVADSVENLAHFSKPTTPLGQAAYAKARIVGILECATHAIHAADVDPHGVAEHILTQGVIDRLKPGMLCLGGRGFFSYDLWQRAANTGAQLLWRAKGNYWIETVAELEDGSYLGNVYHHKDRGRKSPFLLRVIEYQISEGGGHDVSHEAFSHHHRS